VIANAVETKTTNKNPMFKPDVLRNRSVIDSRGRACIAAKSLLMQPFTSAAGPSNQPGRASVKKEIPIIS